MYKKDKRAKVILSRLKAMQHRQLSSIRLAKFAFKKFLVKKRFYLYSFEFLCNYNVRKSFIKSFLVPFGSTVRCREIVSLLLFFLLFLPPTQIFVFPSHFYITNMYLIKYLICMRMSVYVNIERKQIWLQTSVTSFEQISGFDDSPFYYSMDVWLLGLLSRSEYFENRNCFQSGYFC